MSGFHFTLSGHYTTGFVVGAILATLLWRCLLGAAVLLGFLNFHTVHTCTLLLLECWKCSGTLITFGQLGSLLIHKMNHGYDWGGGMLQRNIKQMQLCSELIRAVVYRGTDGQLGQMHPSKVLTECILNFLWSDFTGTDVDYQVLFWSFQCPRPLSTAVQTNRKFPYFQDVGCNKTWPM